MLEAPCTALCLDSSSGSRQRTAAFELHRQGASDLSSPALVRCPKRTGGGGHAHVPLYFYAHDQAADVMDAQKCGLGYSSLRRSLSSTGVLAGTVMKVAMDQGIRTYEAMELRGYKATCLLALCRGIFLERSLDFVPDLGSDSGCIHPAEWGAL